jgi:uracil-DNA glycosylase family 4
MRDVDKGKQYAALVQARKQCRACAELTNPSACREGVFDCDEVGAWSTWQGNLNARLMVVGQDWGDVDWFVRERGQSTNTSQTNRTLVKLLGIAGEHISLPRDTKARGVVFLTNAILCLKDGGAQARVRKDWFANCGARFLRPLIELVRPKVVVGLGQHAYTAILSCYGLKTGSFKAAVANDNPMQLTPGIHVFAAYHCGARILNTHRHLGAQSEDWRRIGEFLKAAS